MHCIGVCVSSLEKGHNVRDDLDYWAGCAFDYYTPMIDHWGPYMDNEKTIRSFIYGTDIDDIDKYLDYMKEKCCQLIDGSNKFESEYYTGDGGFAKSKDYVDYIERCVRWQLINYPEDTCLMFYDYHV